MSKTPNHPGDDTRRTSDAAPTRSPWIYVGAVVGLIVLLVALHLTGIVGP